MKGRGERAALVLLATIAAVAVVGPWLGLRDPAAQPGGGVIADLPPLSRAEAALRADGSLLYAHEFGQVVDGALPYRRHQTWHALPVGELAGETRSQWYRRPLFLLGTDEFGRDSLSRLVHGARVSLWIGLLAAAMSMGIGTAVGLVAGFAGGWIDSLLMRLTDVALAVPRLFLAVLIVALYDPSLSGTIVVLGTTTWMAAARMVRGQVLSLRERDFVLAARASGAAPARTMLAHLLPSTLGTVQVEGTLRVADAILLEAALSFMHLGVQPPRPSWGNLILEGSDHLLEMWWVSLFPGLAVAATVIALQRLGDGMSTSRGT